MNDTKLADLAVSILSQLPTPKVEAFSARGGVVLLELQSQDGVYIVADAPKPCTRRSRRSAYGCWCGTCCVARASAPRRAPPSRSWR
jgi:hypothetical protein